MLIPYMIAKIHRATVTSTDIHYEGSIAIDEDIMEKAGLRVFQKVDVYNVNNGARWSTYILPWPRGTRGIVVNGAAARLVHAGDRIMADLADIAGAYPQAGQAADGVGRRTAACLLLFEMGDLAQDGVDLPGAYQGHAALGQVEGGQQLVIRYAHQDIDQGVSQAKYFFHEVSFASFKASFA